jgi:hypothetical protein
VFCLSWPLWLYKGILSLVKQSSFILYAFQSINKVSFILFSLFLVLNLVYARGCSPRPRVNNPLCLGVVSYSIGGGYMIPFFALFYDIMYV